MEQRRVEPARLAWEIVATVVLTAVTFLGTFYAVALAGLVASWFGVVTALIAVAGGLYETVRGDTRGRLLGATAALAALLALFIVVTTVSLEPAH